MGFFKYPHDSVMFCRIDLDVILNLNAYGCDSTHNRLEENLSVKHQSQRVLNAGDHRDKVCFYIAGNPFMMSWF